MDASEIARLADFEEWYWWHRARQTIVTTLLQRFHAGSQGRILDVGCGAGATSLVLRDIGRVLGVDFGQEAAAAARTRGLEVAQMDAGRLAVRDAAFDVVVALDVLEHLDDDAGAARELLRALRPGGLLLITVPAYRWLWSSHDVALGHRRRYRRPEVERVLRDAGFEVRLCSYVMTSVLPPAAVVRLVDRFRRHRSTDATAESGYVQIPRLLNEVLSHLVGFEGHLVGRVPLPFGLTVTAVARRPLR